MPRVGLVGIGDAGRLHARALTQLSREVEWTAVVARDPAKLAAFELPPGVAVFPSLDALLDAGVCDAVVLATPDGLHAEHVIQVVERGLHVLVEKPLALSRADGERAVEAARKKNVRLEVGYHLRHHAAHRIALARLHELVGAVQTVSVRWAWPDPATDGWRALGTHAKFWSLAALGTHAIDLALLFAGSGGAAGPFEVAALTRPAHGIDRAAEVSFAVGDVLAHISVSVTHRAVSRLVITGDRGELEAVGTLGARGDGELFHRAPRLAPVSIAFTPENPYVAQLREFAASVPTGFSSDSALLANLDILDRIGEAR